jgi:putative DNA primase/helicase
MIIQKYAFVTPNLVIGETDRQRVIYQTDNPMPSPIRRRGELGDWKESIASLCRGNSRLMFAVSFAFAPVLLMLVGEESGGINICGQSSTGKTTLLLAGCSVFGGADYLKTWRVTSNGVESIAVAFCDLPLFLDEMHQVSPDELFEIAYLLANGRGKARANRSGGARPIQSWRTLFMSSGETGLESHIQRVGRQVTAGQSVRVVDLPADAGAKLGVFEELHGRKSGDEFAREIKNNARQYYGTVGEEWLRLVIAKQHDVPGLIANLREKFLAKAELPEGASGQVKRIASRFALIAAAGELATLYGLTGWTQGEAEDAVLRCLKDCLEARGGTGAQEPTAILSAVRLFLEQHGEARFTEWKVCGSGDNTRTTINRAGFRKTDDKGDSEFFIFTEVFKREVLKGFDMKLAIEALTDAGWLKRGADKKPASNHRLPGIGNKRVYHLSASALADVEEVDDTSPI